VLAEVYAQRALPLPEHIGVSLVLHKVVDPRQGVRDAARGLLGLLARRAWGRDARYRCASACSACCIGLGKRCIVLP
jgi:hypothetical protein